MMASGGVVASGLGTLFFLAVVGVAMYGERRDSTIIVALVVGFLTLVMILSTPQGAATTGRRLLFLGAIAVGDVGVHPRPPGASRGVEPAHCDSYYTSPRP